MANIANYVPVYPGRTADEALGRGLAVVVGAAAHGAKLSTTSVDFLGVMVEDCTSGDVPIIAGPGSYAYVYLATACTTCTDGAKLKPTASGEWTLVTNGDVSCAKAMEAGAADTYVWAKIEDSNSVVAVAKH